jgi:hypothetical protein
LEGGGREIEVSESTTFATISDCDSNALSTSASNDLLATDGVVVGIAVVIAREAIKEVTGNGDNKVTIVVNNTASSETSIVESALARLGANQEARKVSSWCLRWGRRFLLLGACRLLNRGRFLSGLRFYMGIGGLLGSLRFYMSSSEFLGGPRFYRGSSGFLGGFRFFMSSRCRRRGHLSRSRARTL